MDEGRITIVSGLPRSGTSMMMQMLHRGGMEVLHDNVRAPDDDNPRGYYEFEKVKRLKRDKSWLPSAKGKVVKVISALLEHLPQEYSYRVIFLLRDMDEILASQKQMLRRGEKRHESVLDEGLVRTYRSHLEKMNKWFVDQPNFQVLYVDYNEVLERPVESSEKIKDFLGHALDVAGMAEVVDRRLYRQRRKTQNNS